MPQGGEDEQTLRILTQITNYVRILTIGQGWMSQCFPLTFVTKLNVKIPQGQH